MQMSAEINNLAEALSKAQGEMRPAKKNSSNPFHKSHYADLDDCWAALREPLSKHGLSVMQLMEEKNGQQILVTILAHISGQWVRSETPIMSKDPSSQAFGSATSYSRRYGLCAITGLTASDDDDGEAADGRSESKPQPSAYPQNDSQFASEAQVKAMYAIAGKSEKEYVEGLLSRLGYKSFSEVKKKDASQMIQDLQAHANTRNGIKS